MFVQPKAVLSSFSQHPQQRYLGRISFVITAAYVGMATAELHLLYDLFRKSWIVF